MVMVVGAVSAVDISDIMGDFSDHRITCGRMKKWTQLNSLKSMTGCANHLAAIAGRSTGSRRWRTMIKATIKTGEKGELELEGTVKEITGEVADLIQTVYLTLDEPTRAIYKEVLLIAIREGMILNGN